MEKVLFFVLTIIYSFEVFAADQKIVYFETVHEGFPKLIAKAFKDVQFLAFRNQKVKEFSIPYETESLPISCDAQELPIPCGVVSSDLCLTKATEQESTITVSVGSNECAGTISICNAENIDSPLLQFKISEKDHYSPASVEFLYVSEGVNAALYRPSMGGGDRFILALGKNKYDISNEKMQEVLPWGSIQCFFPVCKVEGSYGSIVTF